MNQPSLHNNSLTEIRHFLHQHPELSGEEQQTADYITALLQPLQPDQLLTGIATTGVAAVFDSGIAGKTLLFRCELDALPIHETHDEPYRSLTDGISHQCGHDGHMAIILGLAQKIAANHPKRGRVVLLFQPAEETGEGARAVVADPQFAAIAPDESYALHNLPGYPLGQVLLRSGTFNCASRGMIIRLSGRTAHAAYPETGNSPQLALATLLHQLGEIPQTLTADELAMITIVHCQMGEQAFGTAPADGCVMATLRTETNDTMQALMDACTALAEQLAEKYQLQLHIDWSDIFDASVNDDSCAQQVAAATQQTGNDVQWLDEPFRWSEDFGAISAVSRGAMFAFGAGVDEPQIHNPDYRFADALIEQGRDIFFEIYRQQLL